VWSTRRYPPSVVMQAHSLRPASRSTATVQPSPLSLAGLDQQGHRRTGKQGRRRERVRALPGILRGTAGSDPIASRNAPESLANICPCLLDDQDKLTLDLQVANFDHFMVKYIYGAPNIF
jgi:hypothetical protein